MMASREEELSVHQRIKILLGGGVGEHSGVKKAHHRTHSKHRDREVSPRRSSRHKKEHRRHEKGHRHREEKGHHRHHRHRVGGDKDPKRSHQHHGKSKRHSPPSPSPESPPPLPKRNRRDWTEYGGGDFHRGGGGDFRPQQDVRSTGHHPPPHHWLPHEPPRPHSHRPCMPPRFVDAAPVPGCFPGALWSFKHFLMSLEPSVDEAEAVRRYSDYKVTLGRQQLEEFFLAHKDEEWFRLRYHPKEVERWDAENHNALQKRRRVFMYLLEQGWFDHVSLDTEQSPAIIKILDAVRIMFEGGTEYDLQVLEEAGKREEEGKRHTNCHNTKRLEKEERKCSRAEEEQKSSRTEEEERRRKRKGKERQQQSGESEEEETACKTQKEEERGRKKRKGKEKERQHSGESQVPPLKQDGDAGQAVGCPELRTTHREKRRVDSAMEKKGEERGEESTEKGEKMRECEQKKEDRVQKKVEEKRDETEEEEQESEEKEREKEESQRNTPLPPRPLHKTQSLFLRSLPPTISKQDIVNLCAKYSGFLRVCLSEPSPEFRFFRRCWVTFDHQTNVEKICLELQNYRVCEYYLRPLVHRELYRRVRVANCIVQHRTLLQEHIRLSAKIIHSLDTRWTLWGPDQKNPVLKNVSHHLVEEASAEEEELTGHVGGASPHAEVTMERDDKLVKVLDRLLLYLRIVHSVDFYGACHHPFESQMPSCCGTIHARGPLPPNRVPAQQIVEWHRGFESKLSHVLGAKASLAEGELERMGRKEPQQEVDKFIRANTRELATDKWQCRLCDKKFKGADFVRKHVALRHGEQQGEVWSEAVFFNNFLMDPKRPHPPMEHAPPPGPPRPEHVGAGPPQGVGGFFNYEGTYGGDNRHLGWGRSGPERRPQGHRPRKSTYQDLDVPEDDFF